MNEQVRRTFAKVPVAPEKVALWFPLGSTIGYGGGENFGTSVVEGDYWGGVARRGDGNDDHIMTTNWGSFGSNAINDWACVATVQSTKLTDNDIMFGVQNSADDTIIRGRTGMGSPSGTLQMELRDADSDRLNVYPDKTVSDGEKYRWVFNKKGNTASDIEYWINGAEQPTSTHSEETFSNPTDFDNSVPIFCTNDTGSIERHFPGVVDNLILYHDSLTPTEIEQDYRQQPWSPFP